MAFDFSQFLGVDVSVDAHETETVDGIIIQREPVGSSGTETYAGYYAEEYLTSLRGVARAKEFDKMRRSDSNAKMCLSAFKNPIKSSTCEIQPGADEDIYKKHAEFVEHILFNDLDTSWKKILNEALTQIDFGHAVFEITNKNVIGHKKFGNYTGIKDLQFISQKTIERWNLNPRTGKLLSISQYAYGDLQRLVNIDSKFLLVFTVDMEGSNYEGISLLRPCYGNYFRKNNYLKHNAIGVEKFAVPTPIMTVPNNSQKDQYDKAIAVLESYINHHKNYLIKPEGFELELNNNTYDPDKVETSIDREDARMTKAFLANFLELGMSSTGSYALSNDLSDFFLNGIQYVADEIADKFNKEVIPKLIKMNFGEQEEYPKMKFSGISDKAGKELAEILDKLIQNKVIIPDDDMEKSMRKRLNLTQKSDEGIREVNNEPSQAPLTFSERLRKAING